LTSAKELKTTSRHGSLKEELVQHLQDHPLWACVGGVIEEVQRNLGKVLALEEKISGKDDAVGTSMEGAVTGGG
jgi:hypothetical protein